MEEESGGAARIIHLRHEKRKAKALVTRLLNKLAMLVSDDRPGQKAVSDLLGRIGEQKEDTLEVMNRLESQYRANKDEDNAIKVGDEADAFVDQGDGDTSQACAVLASLAKAQSCPSYVADSQVSERRREKQRAEIEVRLRKERIEEGIRRKQEELENEEKQLQTAIKKSNRSRRRKEFGELSLLSDLTIPRCLRMDGDVKDFKLHTFTDASGKAYTAAVYARLEYKDDSTTTQLVAPKTRLAPLKAISIPRLELMGALIGLRLATISSALDSHERSNLLGGQHERWILDPRTEPRL